MKNIFKQFVGWATHLNLSDFRWAIIKLTIYYMAGVFIILAIFNFLVFGLFTNSLQPKDNENIEHVLNKENNTQELQDNLVSILLTSDLLILFLALIVAYMTSKKTLAPLEVAYKKQSRFVADAAHELRTPLAVMKAGSEVILRTDRNKNDYINFIKESLEEVERLTVLSNDLLFLSHKNEKIQQLFKEVSFSELCHKQINIMKTYAQTKKISINAHIDYNIIVLGQKEDLTRLIINLLKNAIDYNRENGQVIISLKKVGSNAILKIEDTGIGIHEKDLPYIFERFYKADNSRTQNSSGTGLGLAIVSDIILKHKGSINCQSILGEKTIFEISLPCV